MITEKDALAPEIYNFAWEVDRYADGDVRNAIYWENEQGDTRTVTYQELRTLSNKLANAMKQTGLKKGDVVIILLPKIPETYIAYLAALKLGLVISPGSEMLMPKDILHRAQLSNASAVICHQDLTHRIEDIRSEVKHLKHFIAVGGAAEGWQQLEPMMDEGSDNFQYVETRSDDIAFLNFTSGTTGQPKGVVHHHSFACAHQSIASKHWLEIQPGDVVWSTTAPGWAKWQHNAFMCVLGAGVTGLVYHGRFKPEKHLELLEKYQVNILCTTPTEFRSIAKYEQLGDYKLPQLRRASSAGEPLSRHVIDTFKSCFDVEIRDGYGQTECTLMVATLAGVGAKPGSMGKPVFNDKIALIDRDGNVVDCPDTIGEIVAHTSYPGLFKGYLNDPERTAAAFRGGWYRTGDYAKMDEEGYFYYVGRGDDIIISSGYTIGPSEVEEALLKHELVKECAVIASPDEIRGSIVKAYIVLKDRGAGTDSLVKELQGYVKTMTAPYKYPREIEFVPDLPKTNTGKVMRAQLREQEREKKPI